ncbi:MAG: phosphatidylserine decarboxylase [Candidatus Methanofastidiosum methylothiophilum]|uniref:Phosphatidylserine decarboxylase n=1 Tax=Candidatus Methanofastidiosum methylothiophilum TaxID=1705564 RepID=A0A150J1A4_9EURY|nr:MAG: phosphatidylserine decarboxylase [Candidatus Methanofastidiosum methylthiophilus]KYC48221.1 MAG: phosphatidylserine decarboxylase [Candidatus Methanofastidiosum methylthiophilus]KYC50878.1 MAG: phosphatidylserine decarboxylase [Candidatus Methanofastidiosum methylthiophilus]
MPIFLTFVVPQLRKNAFILLSLILIGFVIFSISFYRDPERSIPIENDIIISPADGKIMSIDTVKIGEVPFTIKNGKKINLPELKGIIEENYTMVSIFMGPFDVHVNRAPISGKVSKVIYIEGGHYPAFGEVFTENERNIVVIDGNTRTVTVQIAGTVARRIECYVDDGQTLMIGDKIGRIKLGSQVVIIYPSKLKTIVKVGDMVRAGESIIGII